MGQGSVGYKPGGAGGAIDDQAVSLLYMACVLGSEPQARRSLDNGADVNNPGLSPLHVAAWFTALMLAAMNNHTDSVKMLLHNGAEVVPSDIYDLSVTGKKIAKDVVDILHEAAGMNRPRKETKRRRSTAKPVPRKETTRPRPATEPVPGDVRHLSGNILVEYVAHFVIVVLFGIIAFAFVSIGHFYLVATVLFTPLLVVAGFVAGYGALISFVLVVGGSCQVALWRWGDEWAEARAARAERDLLKGDAPAPARDRGDRGAARRAPAPPGGRGRGRSKSRPRPPSPSPPRRPAPRPPAPRSPSAEEVDPTVRALLASLGLSSFEATFAEHLIDADALPLMTVEDLVEEMGIPVTVAASIVEATRAVSEASSPSPSRNPTRSPSRRRRSRARAEAEAAPAPEPSAPEPGRSPSSPSPRPARRPAGARRGARRRGPGAPVADAGDARRTGVCQSYVPMKKYGFIKPDEAGGSDIFVHANNIREGAVISEGDLVEYGVAPYKDRVKAVDEPEPRRRARVSAPRGAPAPEPEFSAIHAARMAHSKLAVDEVMDDAARHQAALEAELADHRALERLRIRRDEVPERLTCPLTLELMKQPVIACDGHTYERCAIQQWLERAKTSPVTNEQLRTPDLIPNHAMKAMIAEFLDHSRATL
ncbi:hypothetical protein JL721_10709 [Aureococcus anophagefferens]|nr:hypothetical protein JL721_10709 [Aureococcus anophagefferens]